jgi:ribonuclease E
VLFRSKKVEKAMKDEMAGDRARSTMLPISQLGIMEMTRQRARRSLKRTLFTVCPSCRGSGVRKTPEAVALEFVRRVRAHFEERSGELAASVHPETAAAISNHKRGAIAELEKERGGRVRLCPDANLALDDMRFAWQKTGK